MPGAPIHGPNARCLESSPFYMNSPTGARPSKGADSVAAVTLVRPWKAAPANPVGAPGSNARLLLEVEEAHEPRVRCGAFVGRSSRPCLLSPKLPPRFPDRACDAHIRTAQC